MQRSSTISPSQSYKYDAYGNDAGTKLTLLLKAHIATAGDIITAAKAHDHDAVTKANTAWYADADQIAIGHRSAASAH